MQQRAVRRQPSETGAHEAGLHLDGHHAGRAEMARLAGCARRAPSPRRAAHRHAAVGDAPGVRQLVAQRQRDLGAAGLARDQPMPRWGRRRGSGQETYPPPWCTGENTAVHRQDLPGDVLAAAEANSNAPRPSGRRRRRCGAAALWPRRSVSHASSVPLGHLAGEEARRQMALTVMPCSPTGRAARAREFTTAPLAGAVGDEFTSPGAEAGDRRR